MSIYPWTKFEWKLLHVYLKKERYEEAQRGIELARQVRIAAQMRLPDDLVKWPSEDQTFGETPIRPWGT